MKENLFLEWKVINRQVRTMKLRCFITVNVTNMTLVDYHGLWSQVYTCNCAAITLLSFFFLIHPFYLNGSCKESTIYNALALPAENHSTLRLLFCYIRDTLVAVQ